ncbi:hypothetical protein CYY_003411 [Polysphondylium violaceum]|uniref:Peptidase S54 rhomboid domain-containing protein n=1 Tax=Polysphondylium violaceum TaxID=133409 RepID=A0A8J4PZC3_9MYCE|nr:hypothetical protein CYY_003411 [Polysphondylium violaceum]
MENVIRDNLLRIPLVTRSFLILCVSLFVLTAGVKVLAVRDVCFSPYYFSSFRHVYTIITSSYFHINALHLLFNMMSFVGLGSNVEKAKCGSLLFLYLVLFFGIFIGFMILGLSYLLFTLGFNTAYYSCHIGLSGIVFALLEIECYGDYNRRLFASINIPSKYYPLVVVIITQIIFPQASLVAHLAGIFVGYLYVNGYLNIMIPSTRLQNIENHGYLQYNGYITLQQNVLPQFDSTSQSTGLPASLSNFTSRVSNVFSSQGRQLGMNNIGDSNNNNTGSSIESIDNSNNEPYVPMTMNYSPSVDMSLNNPNNTNSKDNNNNNLPK